MMKIGDKVIINSIKYDCKLNDYVGTIIDSYGGRMMKVYEAKLGEVINIKNASENPCIKTASSVIDRWGSNWSLLECGNLECTISKTHVTKAAYREFALQVRSGNVYK